MNEMAIFWLVLFVLFLVTEAITLMITTMWFAGGALVAMLAALFGVQVWLQVVLFAVVSAGLLLALRPLVRKYIKPRIVPTNVDAVIDSEGVVIERIDNIAGTGRVKLKGMEWSARSSDNKQIEKGTIIKVVRIEGVKVYVATVKVEAK